MRIFFNLICSVLLIYSISTPVLAQSQMQEVVRSNGNVAVQTVGTNAFVISKRTGVLISVLCEDKNIHISTEMSYNFVTSRINYKNGNLVQFDSQYLSYRSHFQNDEDWKLAVQIAALQPEELIITQKSIFFRKVDANSLTVVHILYALRARYGSKFLLQVALPHACNQLVPSYGFDFSTPYVPFKIGEPPRNGPGILQ